MRKRPAATGFNPARLDATQSRSATSPNCNVAHHRVADGRADQIANSVFIEPVRHMEFDVPCCPSRVFERRDADVFEALGEHIGERSCGCFPHMTPVRSLLPNDETPCELSGMWISRLSRNCHLSDKNQFGVIKQVVTEARAVFSPMLSTAATVSDLRQRSE